MCDFNDNDPHRAIYLKVVPRVGYCCDIPSNVFVVVIIAVVLFG